MSKYIILALLFTASCAKPEEAQCDETASNQVIPKSDGRPTVLEIGDSISMGYVKYVRAGLEDKQVVHNPCNAKNTTYTLSKLDSWLDTRDQFDTITFNNGMWDTAFSTDDPFEVPVDKYAENIRLIAEKVKAKTDNPFFVLTTESPANVEPLGKNDRILQYNQAATDVINDVGGIGIIDLYTVSTTIRSLHDDAASGANVHFIPAGYQVLGNAILDVIGGI